MAKPHLRVFRPEGNECESTAEQTKKSPATSPQTTLPHDLDQTSSMHEDAMVTVSAGDFFHLLQDAVQTNRVWIKDFADDQVAISRDLYEVLLAYQRLLGAAKSERRDHRKAA